jgi:hypothetical protein
MTTNNNMASGGAPSPKYSVQFNPEHFEEVVSPSGKPVGFQEVWQEVADGWWLASHVVRDETGVFIRKAFARRGLRADGSWEQSVAVGTYDVAAIESLTAAKSSAPKIEAEDEATKSATDDYLTSRYGWVAKKRA